MTAALYPQSFVFRALTTSGALAPLAGGMLYFYKAGTLTPQAAYTDPSGATPCSNPLVLDGNGVATFCLQSGLLYKINLTDANGVVQDGYPIDNITADATGLIGASRYAIDTGSVNAVSVTLNPPITSYYNGLRISIKAAVTNTGATTINAGGGAVALVTNAGATLTAANIVVGSIFDAIYDSATSKFWIAAPIVPNNYAQDVGTPNTYVIYTQAGTDYNGLRVSFKALNSNTGASTLNVGGGAKALVTNTGVALPTVGTTCKSAVIVAGTIYEAIYDLATTSYWLVVPPALNTYLTDTGTANAYVIAAMPAYSDGARVIFKAIHTNTTASTINAGAGVVPLVSNSGSALIASQIISGTIYEAAYDLASTSFRLVSSTTAMVNTNLITQAAGPFTTSSSTLKMAGISSGVSNMVGTGSGVFLIVLTCLATNSISGGKSTVQMVWSNGTGPANGAAPIGVTNSYPQTYIQAGGLTYPITIATAAVTSMNPSWVDLQICDPTGTGVVSITNVQVSLMEA